MKLFKEKLTFFWLSICFAARSEIIFTKTYQLVGSDLVVRISLSLSLSLVKVSG